jgi:very-short-patch-repair endonuclease
MKVKDLSGRIHSWNLTGCTPSRLASRPRSDLHLKTRQLMQEEFKNDPILEEVAIPGEQLFLDFYLPKRKMAVEAQGEQHYKFIKHFHGDIMGFKKQKQNDVRKREWCEINGIILITLSYSENIDEWRAKFR